METMWIPSFDTLRRTTIVMVVANLSVVIIGTILLLVSSSDCNDKHVFPLAAVSFAAAVKIAALVKAGMAQQVTASSIVGSPSQRNVVDDVDRNERRKSYKTWLWWTRFALGISVLQFVGALYLIFHVVQLATHDGVTKDCLLGLMSTSSKWKQNLVVSFMILVCFVAVLQCFTGSEVLRWRSFYATQDDAWKAHYQEVFDNGIREAMCCLGRVEYMSVLEEDEVYSVARLLGDLVTYRASGTGHLELLAGLALLQRHSQSPKCYDGFADAPEEHLLAAARFHKFAEAAYTGPLLDFGRNPILFPCAWFYRQGFLTPWTRNRRPLLDGDNWWRGHAAAFLNFLNLSPDALRRGRVAQEKCEVAYFVVVLHQLRCVVIAIRGTETPEDLIIDGLGGACSLSSQDLDGLLNSKHIHSNVKLRVESSFPHYGHFGIVEAARDLFKQIEGDPLDESESNGFLSSLLGAGCECDGYSVRVVGHSMGGAIATLLALRLYGKFPNLHAYTYGPLPCVDSVIADACSEFVTSIVHDNEFSARLSVGSIIRLRAAAISALSQEFKTDSTLMSRLAHRLIYVSDCQRGVIEMQEPAGGHYSMSSQDSDDHFLHRRKEQNQDLYRWHEAESRKNGFETSHKQFVNSFHDIAVDDNPFHDPTADVNPFQDIPLDVNPLQGKTNDVKLFQTKTNNGNHSQGTPTGVNPFHDTTSDVNPFYNTTTTDVNPFHKTTTDINPFHADVNPLDDPVSQFMETVPRADSRSARDPPELFLPGVVIHIVPHEDNSVPLWKSWGTNDRSYKAFLSDKDSFRDIVVSHSMFIDHFPWRCDRAMQAVLKDRKIQRRVDESRMV